MQDILGILNEDDAGDFRIQIAPDTRFVEKKLTNLKVEPMIKEKDVKFPPPHPNLLPVPFSLLITAPKGSGKTVLLQWLIDKYRHYFHNIFIFSPTVLLDRKWMQFLEMQKIPIENVCQTYSEFSMNILMDKIKHINKGRENKDKIRILIVFDDINSKLPGRARDSALNTLAQNHRHFMVSHIILSQTFKMLNPVVRNNTTGHIIFDIVDNTEREKVFEELCGRYPKEVFELMYNKAVGKDWGFLFINKDPGNKNIYENFDTQVGTYKFNEKDAEERKKLIMAKYPNLYDNVNNVKNEKQIDNK